MNKTKHLYLTLADLGPSRAFHCTDTLAMRVGTTRKTLKNMIDILIRDGAVQRVPKQPPYRDRFAPRTDYYLTGVPYVDPVTKGSLNPPTTEPRVVRGESYPRWRNLSAWLLGDPPVGRSARDGFPSIDDGSRHRASL